MAGTRAGDDVYHTTRWRVLRKAVIESEPFCRMCGIAPAQAVDHIIAITDGGHKWDRRNLQPVCHPCHNRKRSKLSVCWHGYFFDECATCQAARGGLFADGSEPGLPPA